MSQHKGKQTSNNKETTGPSLKNEKVQPLPDDSCRVDTNEEDIADSPNQPVKFNDNSNIKNIIRDSFMNNRDSFVDA